MRYYRSLEERAGERSLTCETMLTDDGKPITSQESWSDLEAGDCSDYPRPDERRETFLLVLRYKSVFFSYHIFC